MTKDTKFLIIIRGCPGAGKTTTAELFSENGLYPVISADDYFYILGNGKYAFNIKELHHAHQYCKYEVTEHLKKGVTKVLVANTFTHERDINPYKKLAEEYGYKFVSIIVENRHGNTSVHNVPAETFKTMKKEFNISL